MSWEIREGTGPYYYRKERQPGGRVRSRYVGKGLLAECVAELDGAARALARYRAAGVQRAESTLDGAGEAVEALTASVRSRLDAYMEGEGYCYRKGEWRKPRASSRPQSGSDSDRSGPCAPSAIPPSALDAVRQVGVSDVDEESESMPQPDMPSQTEASHLTPLAHVPELTREAWRARVHAERMLADGDGDPTHPAVQAYRAGAGALAGGWGDRKGLPVGQAVYEMSYLERRRLRGRIALGRTAASAPHDGTAAGAALAVAAVFDEVGVDGRAALVAAVEGSRQGLGWDAASGLGRAVVDQVVLAGIYVDLAVAFETAAAWVREAGPRDADAAVLDRLGAVAEDLGLSGDAFRSTARSERASGASTEAAWRRRTRRARRRLADAERLLRHARKGGLVPASSSGVHSLAPLIEAPVTDDPIAALSAPAPLEPLQGEAAEFAERMGQIVAKMRASWPPPARIRKSELFAADCPWNPFSYMPDFDDEDESPWWTLCDEHETPDEVAADLATWAPEHVPPRYESSPIEIECLGKRTQGVSV